MTEEQKSNSEEKYKMLTEPKIVYVVVRTSYSVGSGPNYDEQLDYLEAWTTEEQALKACVDYQNLVIKRDDFYGADHIGHHVEPVVLRGV